MAAFLVRRVLSGLLLVAILTFLTFVVFNEIPTNPACLVVACGPKTTTTDAQIREADHTLGIDRSVFAQYADFEWNLIRHADFGKAWTKNQQVGSLISDGLPATASLVAGGMLLMMLLALPLGCISALRPRSPVDRGLLAASVVGLAVHPFVLGITIRDLVSNRLHFFSGGYCPLTGKSPGIPFIVNGTTTFSAGCGGPVDWAKHLLVPWLVFALFFLPLYMRMLRVRLLETFDEPWISTARAKGASERRVVLGHALRNAIGPVLPMIAIDAGTAITAAIYVETVFGLGGLGTLAVEAFSGQAGGYDLPLTAGIVTTLGAFVVLLNITADVAGAWVDPRTRTRATKGLIPLPTAVAAHPRAQRALSLGLAAAVLVLLAIAVGLGGRSNGNGIALGTPVRTVKVDWSDVSPFTSKTGVPTKDTVVTHVSKIELGVYGWRVHASISNRSGTRIPVDDRQTTPFFGGTPGPEPYPHQPTSLLVRGADQFGGTILKVLEAKEFVPAMPPTLRPQQTWRGTFAGSAKVPSGALLYVGFGQFLWNGEPVSISTAKSTNAP